MYGKFLSFTTLWRYVVCLGAKVFKFPWRVIFAGFLAEDELRPKLSLLSAHFIVVMDLIESDIFNTNWIVTACSIHVSNVLLIDRAKHICFCRVLAGTAPIFLEVKHVFLVFSFCSPTLTAVGSWHFGSTQERFCIFQIRPTHFVCKNGWNHRDSGAQFANERTVLQKWNCSRTDS